MGNRSGAKTILCYTGPRALSSSLRRGLARLGYRLVDDGEQEWRAGFPEPDLRLADERRTSELPSPDEDPDTPIVLLTGARPRFDYDPRVTGLVRRPVSLRSLYAVFQESLELHPRRSPRVPTGLPARGIRRECTTVGAVTSLSAHGCRFQSGAPVGVGEWVQLQFALPGRGLVAASSRCVHHTDESAGLVFEGDPSIHDRIDAWVSDQLAR